MDYIVNTPFLFVAKSIYIPATVVWELDLINMFIALTRKFGEEGNGVQLNQIIKAAPIYNGHKGQSLCSLHCDSLCLSR